MNLDSNVKRLRENKNLSQRALAEIIGVTPAYVALIETGDRINPSLDVLTKLANALEVSINELIDKPA